MSEKIKNNSVCGEVVIVGEWVETKEIEENAEV